MKRLSVNGWLSIIIILAVVPSNAYAFCREPSIYLTKPSAPNSQWKPLMPICMSNYRSSGRHTCKSWQVDSYINKINDYIHDLNNYVDKATKFANSAIEFANDASDYADCQAKDVKSGFD